MIMGLILALAICAIMNSCKTRERVISDHSYRDSAWTVKVVQNGHGDSVVYKERMVIEPRIIHTGDTTIISMDTTIYKYTERNITNNYNNYYDNGRNVSDSANVKKEEASAPKATNKESTKWRLLWYGIIIGIAIALAALVAVNRNSIIKKIRKLANRNN